MACVLKIGKILTRLSLCKYFLAKFNMLSSSFRFEFHFIPCVRHLTGRIALIGDNLASHFTARVLELCEQHDIIFLCLPPNATHICQPLDVAVYRPLKGYWRVVLTNWKDSDEGKKTPVLPKTMFPVLLKRVFEMMSKTVKANLISGFRKCGIYPLSKDELLSRFSIHSFCESS